MKATLPRSLAGFLSLAVAFAAPSAAQDDPAVGVLTLTHGDSVEGAYSVEGVLQPSDSPDVVRWLATDFVRPLEFRTESIKSIKFPTKAARPAPKGEFAIEFRSNDVLTGSLVAWTSDSIEIDSAEFGRMTVNANAVRRIYRIDENAMLVFASLAGLQDWTTSKWESTGWQEDGNHLWTRQMDATLNGDLRVPDRAVVEFELSWTGQPDFVFAIGVDTQSLADNPSDGFRIETVGGRLAVIRQSGQSADVDMVSDLFGNTRVRLTAYVDQRTGEMKVFQPDGKPVGSVAPKPGQAGEQPQIGRGILLINRGVALRLERLRIAKWMGAIPSRASEGQVNVALAGGEMVSGGVQKLDPDSGKLVIGDADRQSSVDLSKVVAIKFSAENQVVPQPQCALFLHDGMRLSGNLEAIDDNDWILAGQSLKRSLRIPRRRVRSFVVFDHSVKDVVDSPEGRRGRLEVGGHKLLGRLVPAKEQSDQQASCFAWHPTGSRNASPLKLGASGRIVYRDPPKVDTSSSAARALAMQRLRLQQQRRGLNFGQLFLRRADNAKAETAKRDAHVIHVRSGDVIACRVDSIDQRGVHLSTVGSEDGFVSHEKVKAIELVSNASPPSLKEAKRQRLLTIPRLQKSSPPTQLIYALNGDFLRCRLLSLDNDIATVEVQLEVMQVPRARIAQIIWFHPDELPQEDEVDDEADPDNQPLVALDTGEGKVDPFIDRESQNDVAKQAVAKEDDRDEASLSDPGEEYIGLAQVLRRDGKRVTLDPSEVKSGDTLEGVSEILGPYQVSLKEVDQLIFGSRIGAEVSDLAYNRWKLQPAVEPLVNQDSPDAPMLGSNSPLIGEDAPELKLDMLDGSPFVLSEQKGKIVVLDFWASWCAPCMQTMPLVEEAIAEFDAEQVQLLSVNLEEPAEHVRGVLERHKLGAPVALDIDGVAAHRYQARAIPQLVIVGADGVVKRLYVGGGSDVVEQMRASIQQLLNQ